MEAVLKVGGSLAEEPFSLRRLCQELSELAKVHRIAIVPGGGKFADTVSFRRPGDIMQIQVGDRRGDGVAIFIDDRVVHEGNGKIQP